VDGRVVGYGCVRGFRGEPRDVVVEFYVLPAHRGAALPLFRRLAAESGARAVEAQTNDVLLTLLLLDCARGVEPGKVLFHDAATTHLAVAGATFRRVDDAERGRLFPHRWEPVGDWLIEAGGEAVATGGIALHYNPPYGDVYMEVAEPCRRRGYGSFLVQELKRACYEMGRIPAARCDPANAASRATLQRAGFLPCARIRTGTLAP
jgi:GNAT superfamily N-acetyltransferase